MDQAGAASKLLGNNKHIFYQAAFYFDREKCMLTIDTFVKYVLQSDILFDSFRDVLWTFKPGSKNL